MGLFTPGWKSKDEGKALKAVQKETDPKHLGELAKNHSYSGCGIGRKALEKLNDQTILYDVFLNAVDETVRSFAKCKLSDPNLLLEIAENNPNIEDRIWAISKLPDKKRTEKMREEYATYGSDKEFERFVRNSKDIALLRIIISKNKLEKIAAKNRLVELAIAEIEQTDDPGVLVQFAPNTTHSVHAQGNAKTSEVLAAVLEIFSNVPKEVSNAANVRLDKLASIEVIAIEDQFVLSKIALNTEHRARIQAIQKLKGQKTLTLIATNREENSTARKAAIMRLTDSDVISAIALHDDEGIAKTAIDKLKDQRILYNIIKNRSEKLQIAAVQRLRDQNLLGEIARDANMNRETRAVAIERLTDINILNAIINDSTDGYRYTHVESDDIDLGASSVDSTYKSVSATDGLREKAKIRLQWVEQTQPLYNTAQDENTDISERYAAAIKLKKECGDAAPYQKLQQLGEKNVNGHNLYRTIYEEWEQVEYFCLCCGKTGGQTDDEGGTHHYGCLFYKEPCIKA